MTTKRGLRRQLAERLLDARAQIPTSPLGRIGRTAATALRSGRLMLRRRSADDELPEDLDVEAIARIVSSLGQLKGVAMKMGQIMSYIDLAVPEELRTALSVLQTHAQPMSFERVRDIVTTELRDRGRALLEHMHRIPMAAASIGQVHRARLPDGTAVAVKVQYPEIARAIESDFRPAAIGTTLSSIIYPGAKIDGLVEEVRARFLEECDYAHEADRQARFAALYADHPVISVPTVHVEYSAHRVLTTTLVEGAHFDEFLADDPPDEIRDRIGEALFEFYVGSLFRHGLYNCDPHPGNYLMLEDGGIAVLDYGCTRAFEPAFVGKLARLTHAVHADERDGLHGAFVELGMVREGRSYDFDTARSLVRAFYGPMLLDETMAVDLGAAMDMRQVVRRKRQLLKLTLPPEFVFLFRIRFGLLSVLARLGARANWYRLERRHLDAAKTA
jgi:predicted unusual protein kinase regulating ubiquinone biosynthesis (AarF/ABC1/UbiB family)